MMQSDKHFRLERKWKELTPAERKKNRLIYSVPVLEAFFAWAETTRTRQENLRKALNYTLNHKKYFTNFCDDPVYSRWKDDYSQARSSISIYDLINSENI